MTMFRTRVVRADGRAINVVQRRAHLSYCFTGCCCGRTERGYAAVPVDTSRTNGCGASSATFVHLTKAGCLGPCALANVASLVFDGRAVWFHSVNTPWHVRLIYDYIETMITDGHANVPLRTDDAWPDALGAASALSAPASSSTRRMIAARRAIRRSSRLRCAPRAFGWRIWTRPTRSG